MKRIVALHGNVGGPWEWLGLEEALGITLDKRCLWEPGALDFDAGDILLGYSLGGRLALQAAVKDPAKFATVIAISAHPGLSSVAEREARVASDLEWASLARDLPWDEFLRRWDAQDVLGPSPFPRENLEAYRFSIAEGFESWGLGRQEDLKQKVKTIVSPVILMTGDRDFKFSALAAECGVSNHVVIPEAGHRVHLDQPMLAAEAIRSFLERMEGCIPANFPHGDV